MTLVDPAVVPRAVAFWMFRMPVVTAVAPVYELAPDRISLVDAPPVFDKPKPVPVITEETDALFPALVENWTAALFKVRVPPTSATAPSSKVTRFTPVMVPLTVTVYEPVASVPAEKTARPLPTLRVCHVPVVPPFALVDQFPVVFWSQVPLGEVPPEPGVLPLMSQYTLVCAARLEMPSTAAKRAVPNRAQEEIPADATWAGDWTDTFIKDRGVIEDLGGSKS